MTNGTGTGTLPPITGSRRAVPVPASPSGLPTRRRWGRVAAGAVLALLGAWVAMILVATAGGREETLAMARDVERGPRLERAIVRFQRHVGLPDDGVAGPQTLRALRGPPPRAPAPAPPAPAPQPSVLLPEDADDEPTSVAKLAEATLRAAARTSSGRSNGSSVTAAEAIRSTRKLRQSPRSRSQASRYHFRPSGTRRCGSTCRSPTGRQSPGSTAMARWWSAGTTRGMPMSRGG